MPDVDDRIVNIKFDNEQFERGVVATIAALDKLEKSLEFENGTKGFSDIQSAVDTFNLSNMSADIDDVNNKLGVLGVVGATAINELTKKAMEFGSDKLRSFTDVFTDAMSGGKGRFLAIDEAKFKFRGLGLDVEKAMQNANDAVTGTRFSLDAAATAAAQFAGAGVEVGEDMEKSLRSVSGVATQAGMDFSHVSHIFSGIAAMNKVTGHDFQRLESQGFAASQTLAEYMGTTREEVKSLAREGKIDFVTFRDAMLDAFGDNAAKANETYAGALANVRAGLSRIGADMTAGKMEAQRKMYAGLIPVIKELQKALKPLGEALGWIAEYFAQGRLDFAESIDFSRVKVIVEMLVQTFFNIFAMFHRIKKAATEAWKSVFPSDDGQLMWLVKLSGYLYLATKKLQFGSETAEKVKRIFAGLFSIFKIGFLVVKELVGVIGALFSPLTKLIKSADGLGKTGVLEVLAKAGDFIVRIRKSLEHGNIAGFFDNLRGYIHIAYAAIGKFFDTIKTGAGKSTSVISSLGSALMFVWEQVKNASAAIQSFFGDGISSAADKALSALDRLRGKKPSEDETSMGGGALLPASFGMGANLDHIKSSLGLADEAKETEKSGSVILTIFAKIGRGLALLTRGIRNAFVGFTEGSQGMFKDLGVILGKLTVMAVNGALDFITAFATTVRDGIDFKQLAATFAGTGIVGGIIFAIKKAFGGGKAFGSFRDELKGVINSFAGMLEAFGEASKETLADKLKKIAISIAILTASLWVLSKLDWGEIAKGGAVIIGFLGAMVGSIAILNKILKDGKTLGKLGLMPVILSIAAAVLVFSVAVNLLRGMDPDEIGNALTALAVGMATMVGSVKTLAAATTSMGGGKKMMTIAAAMTALGLALVPMAIAVRILGKMDGDALAKGVGAISVFLGVLAAFAITMSKFSDVKTLAALGPMIMGIAFAMILLGIAINTIAVLSWEELAKAGLAIAGFFAIMAIASKTAQTAKFQRLAASMIPLTAGLMLLAIAANIFGTMSWESLGKAGAAILGFFLIMAVVVKIMDSMGVELSKLALELNGLAVGILIMAVALQVLGTMPIEQIALAVGTLFGTLILLGIATKFLGPGIPVFLGFAASLFLIGAATALAGWGLLQVAKAFKTLWSLGSEAVLFFLSTLPMLGTVLAEMVGNFIIGIGSMAQDIAAALGEVFRAVMEELTNSIGSIFDFFREFFDQLIPFIREYFPQIVQLGIDLIMSLLTGIRDNIGEVTNVVIDIILNFINAIADRMGEIIAAGVNLLVEFLNGVADGMINIADTVTDIIVRFVEALGDNIDAIFSAGVDFLVGILDGIANGVADFAGALASILQQLADSAVHVALAFVNAALTLLEGIMTAMIDGIRGIRLLVKDFILNLANEFLTAIIDMRDTLGLIGRAFLDAAIGDMRGGSAIKKALGAEGAMGDLQRELDRSAKQIEGESLRRRFEALGGQMNQGLRNGLAQGDQSTLDYLRTKIQLMERAIQDESDMHSPSKRFMKLGEFMMDGMALGLAKTDNVITTLKGNAKMLEDETKGMLDGIYKAVPYLDDVNPTITPVLDLSDMEKKSKDISNYFADPGIQASFGGVSKSSAFAASNETASTRKDENERPIGDQNITFQQTINSPKALSNAEIFRRNKNQITLAKEDLRKIHDRR